MATKKCVTENQIMLSVNDIHKLCIKNFVYTPDTEQYNLREHWTSHEDAVMQDMIWRDDCDGFAITAAVIALNEGYNPTDIILAFVLTETDMGHLVCCIDNKMIDNRQRSAIAAYMPHYKWIKGMNLKDKIWKTFSED